MGVRTLLAAVAIIFAASPVFAADVAAGKAKYDMLCVTCHGPGGKGDGPSSAALNPKPRDLSSVEWQKSVTDEHIAKVIKEGGAAAGLSPLMPPWGASLSDQDVTNIVAFIRSLGGK